MRIRKISQLAGFVGSITNAYSGSTTDTYSCDYINNIVLEPTVLYNDTGTNTTATLSESAANYSFIEIYFKNNDNFYGSQKVADPDGKKTSLISTYTSSGNWVIKIAGISISGTTITINDYWEFNLNGGSYSSPGNTYITKVIGYK